MGAVIGGLLRVKVGTVIGGLLSVKVGAVDIYRTKWSVKFNHFECEEISN